MGPMTETVELANVHSTAKRIGFAAIGLAVAIFPNWDLWPGIASVSLVSPVFWIIGPGAAGIGGLLLFGAVFGPSTVLTVTPAGLDLLEENLVIQRHRVLRADDLGPVTVVLHEWSEGPDTWRVKVALKGSRPLVSEDFPDRKAAEDLAARLTQALGQHAP